jgi:hypothetical protein
MNNFTLEKYILDKEKLELKFIANGKEFTFSNKLLDFFDLMKDYQPHSFQALQTVTKNIINQEELEKIISILISNNLAYIS